MMATFRATFTVEIDADDLGSALKFAGLGATAMDEAYDGLEVVAMTVRLNDGVES
jgi:hypothetical protein